MKKLEGILSQHIEGGYGAWMKLYDDIIKYRNEFAIEVAKESLRNASENVELKESIQHSAIYDTIDKESILSETNIPKL